MAVYAEYRVYWHSDTKPCLTNVVERKNLDANANLQIIMWYYCAVTGESKKIVFTSGATEKITSGAATSDFWSPHK
jgi:hypothetical protein